MRTAGFLLVFGIILSSPAAVAQHGRYVEDGFGISAGTVTAPYADVRVAAGPVLHPFLEFGGETVLTTDWLAPVDPVSLRGIGPYVSVYPVRQQEGTPVSVSLTGRYTVLTFSRRLPTDVSAPEGDGEGFAFSVRADIFRAVGLSESATLIPRVGFGYARSHTEPEGEPRFQTTFPRVTLSLSVLLHVLDRASVALTPAAAVDHAGGTLSFTLSVAFTHAEEE